MSNQENPKENAGSKESLETRSDALFEALGKSKKKKSRKSSLPWRPLLQCWP